MKCIRLVFRKRSGFLLALGSLESSISIRISISV